MNISGRRLRLPLTIVSVLLALAAALALANRPVSADAAGTQTRQQELPLLANLRQTGQLAAQKKVPILLMFSINDCRYCSKLEHEVLLPMHISGEYDDKVIIRKVLADLKGSIEGFTGDSMHMQQLARNYKVGIYPTVLLLDHTGQPLTNRIVGINSVEMYSWDLELAIEQAYKLLNEG